LIYALVPSPSAGLTKELAFDTDPQSVALGDLVEAYYQNGQDHGRWYRGRVAAVDEENNTCTILLYDDQDLESGVPIGQGKTTLIEKGDTGDTGETGDTGDTGDTGFSWLPALPVHDDFVPTTQGSARKVLVPNWKTGAVTALEEKNGRRHVVVEHEVGGRPATTTLPLGDFRSSLCI